MAVRAAGVPDFGAPRDDESAPARVLERDGVVDCAGEEAGVGGAGWVALCGATSGGGGADAGGGKAAGGLGLGEGSAASRFKGRGLGEGKEGEAAEDAGGEL